MDRPQATSTSREVVLDLLGSTAHQADAPTHIVRQPAALMTTKQTAAFIGVTPAHLQRQRSEGGGIPFVLLGKRKIAYRLSDINAWLAARVASSTTDARERGLTA
jgi:predicted DNA-binding transcriptional regulator AlpA